MAHCMHIETLGSPLKNDSVLMREQLAIVSQIQVFQLCHIGSFARRSEQGTYLIPNFLRDLLRVCRRHVLFEEKTDLIQIVFRIVSPLYLHSRSLIFCFQCIEEIIVIGHPALFDLFLAERKNPK